MRVPNALQGASLLDEIGRIRTALERARREIASGKRLSAFSDDPAAAARASSGRAGLGALEQFRGATDRAMDKLFAVDRVLDVAERLMDAAATAAAAGRSGVAPSEQFQALSEEVDGIREQMLALANTRDGDAYLFAGRKTLTEPFVDTAGVIVYQGDGVAPTVRVGERTVVETTIPGSSLFVGSLDVFEVLADLRDALAAEDQDAVAAAFADVEQVAARISGFRARIGYTLERLEEHRLRLRAAADEERLAIGRDEDANLAEAIGRFGAESTALEAALGSGARLLSVSLMDVLG